MKKIFEFLLACASLLGLVVLYAVYVESRTDAYACEGVSIAHSSSPVHAVPISMNSHMAPLPGYRNDNRRLLERRSVRAECEDLAIEIGDAYHGQNSFHVLVRFVNTGDSSFSIPTASLQLALNREHPEGKGEVALWKPEVSGASIFREELDGTGQRPTGEQRVTEEVQKVKEDAAISSASVGGMLVNPHEEVELTLHIPALFFSSGRLEVPLVDARSNIQTILDFEIKYLFSYSRTFY